MVIQIGNIKIDLEPLQGMSKTAFVKKFKAVFKKPDLVYDSIKDKITLPKRKK